MTVLTLTAFTLTAFAANSLLCRLALGEGLIDPVSFTTVRLVSGAIVLLLLSRLLGASRAEGNANAGSWRSAIALFAYAAAFSLAYVSLSAGTGALILFGAVQLTMLGWAIRSGERLAPVQWLGLSGAAAGLVYLVLPGLTAPDPAGALLMGAAGVAWGAYSILGRGAPAPVLMTAGNFRRAAPVALLASAVALSSARIEMEGFALALGSGMVTSGLGYVLWYRLLRSLTTSQASVLQLLVPVVAASGGVMLLSEEISGRLVASSALILGGVAMAVLRKVPAAAPPVTRAVKPYTPAGGAERRSG